MVISLVFAINIACCLVYRLLSRIW